MADERPESATDGPMPRKSRFPLAIAGIALGIGGMLVPPTVLAAWNDDWTIFARPLTYLGVLFMATCAGIGLLRRRGHVADGRKSPWWRFSIGELMLLATGLAIAAGLVGMEGIQARREQRRYEQLKFDATPLLGPDGFITVGRLPGGRLTNLTIVVCDPTFDDQRLQELARMINDQGLAGLVSGVLRGYSKSLPALPPKPPNYLSGITDKSVETLLGWPRLKWLSLDETSISPTGRQRLTELPYLRLP